MRLILAALCLFLFSSVAVAQNHPGWLDDAANILGDTDEVDIRAAIEDIRSANGVTICVRTISDANGEDVKHIAVRTLNEWAPGPKSVILLVCLDPRKIYLQPGTDVEALFDEAQSNAIVKANMVTHFKCNNYAAGVLAGLAAVRSRLSVSIPVHAHHSNKEDSLPDWLKIAILVAVVIVIVILIAWAIDSSRNGYNSGYSSYNGGSSFFFISSSSGGSSSHSSDSGSSWDSGSSSSDGGGGGGSDF